MDTEIEAKFIHVDHAAVRNKLKQLGAKCEQSMRLMKRKNFDYPDNRLQKIGGWIRVRDEGNKVTLAYKQLNHRGVDGTKEVNVEVNDFETACSFLKSIGMVNKSYQETKRETWTYEDAEIVLDEWPWIDPFIEIEAKDDKTLFEIAEKLGFKKSQALHGSVENAYQDEYDLTEEEIDFWPVYTFGPVPEEWAGKRKHGIKAS